MKYLILFFLVISCSKTVEQNCFQQKGEKDEYVETKPYTVKQILDEKPGYLQIENLKKFKSFKQDSLERKMSTKSDVFNDKFMENYESENAKFIEKFGHQFGYITIQNYQGIDYTFARSHEGFWLLELDNNKPKAHFLGLSFSHFSFNSIKNKNFIVDGFLQLEGSLVQIIKVPGLPGYDDYSGIADGKLFKIRLDEIKKDSDQDGFNDIFEICFGLNPNNKDSDGDGIDDFHDNNPLFKSEKNKFTDLYEKLVNDDLSYKSEVKPKINYMFTVYSSDCEYFQKINPESRVFITPENKSERPFYLKVTDVFWSGFSKMNRNDEYPNVFYIYKFNSGSTTDYRVEFKDNKWLIEIVGGTVS